MLKLQKCVSISAWPKTQVLVGGEENAYSSPLRMPFPSGSNTLNALRMVSSGSVPEGWQVFDTQKGTSKKSYISPGLHVMITTFRLTFELLSKHGQKDGEVDGAGSLLHHLIQFVVTNIKTTWTEIQTGQTSCRCDTAIIKAKALRRLCFPP